MFGLFERKKEKNIIGERIEALDDKLWFIHLAGGNYDIENKIRFSRDEIASVSETYKVATLSTIFGRRKIAVTKNSLYYGREDLIRGNDSGEFIWSFDFNYIFNIRVKDNNVTVNVSPNENLSKEDIDLAILEFEEAIERAYEEVLNREKEHAALVSYLKEGC